jgi:hypothetical protein
MVVIYQYSSVYERAVTPSCDVIPVQILGILYILDKVTSTESNPVASHIPNSGKFTRIFQTRVLLSYLTGHIRFKVNRITERPTTLFRARNKVPFAIYIITYLQHINV